MRSTIAILLVLSLVSCDNSLDPLDREKGIYAVSGALNLEKTENYIRIKDLNAPFTLEATDTLGAVVIFENLESGSRTVLGSNRVEDDGVYLHNFLVNEEILPDTPYRLTVEGSDGESVVIDARAPTKPAPVAFPTKSNCYTAINFEIAPSNGGVIVLKVGMLVPFSSNIYWQTADVITPEMIHGENKFLFTFTPAERLRYVIGYGGQLKCYQLREPNFFISYAHYGPEFYKKVAPEEFDVFGSTDRFGAFFRDTVRVPIDASRVCPQDC